MDVPTNAPLQLRFSEPVSGLALSGVTLLEGGNAVAVEWSQLGVGESGTDLSAFTGSVAEHDLHIESRRPAGHQWQCATDTGGTDVHNRCGCGVGRICVY